MNADLTKYISDVFRNEVRGNADMNVKSNQMQVGKDLVDPKIDQFLLDKRFLLCLDEII